MISHFSNRSRKATRRLGRPTGSFREPTGRFSTSRSDCVDDVPIRRTDPAIARTDVAVARSQLAIARTGATVSQFSNGLQQPNRRLREPNRQVCRTKRKSCRCCRRQAAETRPILTPASLLHQRDRAQPSRTWTPRPPATAQSSRGGKRTCLSCPWAPTSATSIAN